MSDVLAQPLSSTEFLVVDVETNGKSGDDCELTELGAVLVGGGELHDRWETLVGVRAPLSRMIQRFTGISQAMVDEAPAVELVLPDLAEQLEGRVLVGHNIAFDRRVLRQAFARAELEWPDVPTLCTVALARRFAPLARRRGLKPLAEALGIEVEVAHRALADAETTARVLCALLPRLVVHAGTVGDAVELLKAAARRPRRPRAGRTIARQGRAEHRVDVSGPPRRARRLPLPQRRRPGPLHRQVRLPARPRAVALPAQLGLAGLGRAGDDGRPPHDLLRARRARPRAAAHQGDAPAGQRAHEARRPVRLPALPAGHRVPRARGRARARAGALGDDRPAARPARGDRAHGAAQLALHAAPLRPRAAPARASLRLRADGPLPLALPERPRPQPLPPPVGRGARALHRRRRRRSGAPGPRGVRDAPGVGRAALRARGVAAPPAAPPARAHGRPRGPAGDPRPAAARRRAASPRRDGGRVLARGRPPGGLGSRPARGRRGSLADRCAKALRSGDGRGSTSWLAPDEVDEMRVVTTYLASHDLPGPRSGPRSRRRAARGIRRFGDAPQRVV